MTTPTNTEAAKAFKVAQKRYITAYFAGESVCAREIIDAQHAALAMVRTTDLPDRLIEAERENARLKKLLELTKPMTEQDRAFWQHIVDGVMAAGKEPIA
jgi:hypothetical protein